MTFVTQQCYAFNFNKFPVRMNVFFFFFSESFILSLDVVSSLNSCWLLQSAFLINADLYIYIMHSQWI